MSQTLDVHPDLTAHNSQFPRSHMRLGRSVHGFVGYAASNVYQFRIGLSFPAERVNLGCGPGDRPTEGLGAGHLAPTMLIHDPATQAQLAGMPVQLLHIPGETPDHMLIWMPDDGLLISGDNFYHAFPNLSPLRGTPYRDFGLWASGLDQMAALSPRILCPGHTLPVTGEAAIAERLQTTAAAIRHVMQSTEQGLMDGRPLDQIAAEAALPEALATLPWLAPLYGRLDWAVRAYAAGTLGWFDGAPVNIGRMPPRDEAARFVALAGGVEAVRQAAQNSDDPQWALELAERLHLLGAPVHSLRITALRALAEAQINPTARNYYLTAAKAIEATAP